MASTTLILRGLPQLKKCDQESVHQKAPSKRGQHERVTQEVLGGDDKLAGWQGPLSLTLVGVNSACGDPTLPKAPGRAVHLVDLHGCGAAIRGEVGPLQVERPEGNRQG